MPSVILSPSPTRIASIGDAEDPYKKYWWGIVSFFGLVGFWLFLPSMEQGVGSQRVAIAQPTLDESAEQSLNAVGVEAPGLALEMEEGAYRKKAKESTQLSSLYQAQSGDGAAAAGAPLAEGAATAANFAEAMKAVASKKASADDGGWGGRKAQRGFTSPSLGGSLSGLSGGGSGSGSASSYSGGTGAFGSPNVQVGYTGTRGLRDDGLSAAGETALGLAGAAEASQLAAQAKGGAAEALAAAGAAFDGGAKQNGVAGKAGDGSAASQLRAAFDAAPANLKGGDPAINSKKITPPPSAPPPDSGGDNRMAQQMGMMLATAVIGGILPGAAGSIVASMGSQMMQMQQQEAERKRQEQRQQAVSQQMSQQLGGAPGR